jgi:alpha/beta superfamily hydrolase
VTPLTITTADGIALEAEWADPADGTDPKVVVVLAHPHPQYGGTMRSIVISALFDALPRQGYACLRFNFRGVENSEGAYAEGRDEPNDVRAAVATAVERAPGVPCALVGWSFGADMALTVDEPGKIAGWVGIAPPLRFRATSDYAPVGNDDRPKLLVLAAHDEFRAPSEIEADVATWTNTRVEIIPGASHFFVGRTDHVVDAVAGFCAALSS